MKKIFDPFLPLIGIAFFVALFWRAWSTSEGDERNIITYIIVIIVFALIAGAAGAVLPKK